MAITISNTYASGAPSASSLVSPSLQFTTNKLSVVSVFNEFSSTPNTPTITGGGSSTFTQIATALDAGSKRRVTMFRTFNASTQNGAITIDFASQTQNNIKYSVDEVTGMSTAGTNGSGAIVQNANNTTAILNTGITVTLSAFASANNAAYGGVFTNTGSTITVGSGFTSLTNDTGLFADSTEWKINDNTVDWSWSVQTAIALGMAIEIAEPSSATTPLKTLLGAGQ